MEQLLQKSDFEKLHRDNYAQFLRFANRLYGGRIENAKDSVSEVFLHYLEKLEKGPIVLNDLADDSLVVGRKLVYKAIKHQFISDCRKAMTAQKSVQRAGAKEYDTYSAHIVLKLLDEINSVIPHLKLTPTENNVWRLIHNGTGNKEIALELGIAEGTVHVHKANIKGKLLKYFRQIHD